MRKDTNWNQVLQNDRQHFMRRCSARATRRSRRTATPSWCCNPTTPGSTATDLRTPWSEPAPSFVDGTSFGALSAAADVADDVVVVGKDSLRVLELAAVERGEVTPIGEPTAAPSGEEFVAVYGLRASFFVITQSVDAGGAATGTFVRTFSVANGLGAVGVSARAQRDRRRPDSDRPPARPPRLRRVGPAVAHGAERRAPGLDAHVELDVALGPTSDAEFDDVVVSPDGGRAFVVSRGEDWLVVVE